MNSHLAKYKFSYYIAFIRLMTNLTPQRAYELAYTKLMTILGNFDLYYTYPFY